MLIVIIGLIFLVVYCMLNNNTVETYNSVCANNPTCNCYNHDLYPCDYNCQKAKYEVCLIGGRC